MRLKHITKYLFLACLLTTLTATAQTNRVKADHYFNEAARISLFPPGTIDTAVLKQCIGLYTKAIRYNPQFSQAYRNRGRCYADLGMYPNAIADVTKAIKYDRQGNREALYRQRAKYVAKLKR